MKVHKQKHNPALVTAFFASYGIPKPEFEYKFHDTRKWRFDIAWPHSAITPRLKTPVYLEVQGGIWIKGGHNRGAQMKKDWEKYNAATELGWRPLFVEPCDLLKRETAEMIRRALCLG
jgi:hypothetical protein